MAREETDAGERSPPNEELVSRASPGDEDSVASDSSDLEAAREENERLRSALEAADGRKRERRAAKWRRTRKILVGLLVFLTAVMVLASSVAVWVHATVFETDRFVALVEPALEERAVTDALANDVTNQVSQALDLQARVTAALPPALHAIVPPIATATRNFVREKVAEVFRSPGFHDLVLQLVAGAHEKAVALIRKDYDKLPNVVVQEGEIRLDLLPIVTEALRRVAQGAADLVGVNLQIPAASPQDEPGPVLQRLSLALGRPLPPDFGQVTVLTTAQLGPLQDAAASFDRLVILAVILAAVLLVLALVLSVNRRRTLVQMAIAVVAAFLVAWVAIRRIQNAVVEHIASDAGKEAGRRVTGSILSGLRELVILIAVIGVVVAVAAYLAGRPRWFTRVVARTGALVRGRPSGSELAIWASARADALRVAGIAIAVLILLIVGVGLVSFLVVGGLLGLYVWGLDVLRRQVETARSEPPPE